MAEGKKKIPFQKISGIAEIRIISGNVQGVDFLRNYESADGIGNFN